MPDSDPKPSIPSWQRSTLSAAASTPSPAPEPSDAPTTSETPAESSDADAEDSFPQPTESSDVQMDMVTAFLSDPAIKDEPTEVKRAFLAGKDVPVQTIDEVLKESAPATTAEERGKTTATATTEFDRSEFSSFLSQQQPPAAQSQPERSIAPPIITYPEFMLDAHTPQPLVTPARVLNAAYLAAGLATLVYGASAFILKPMSDTMTEARHDFASHTNAKLDEFNERLAKIASKLPPPPKNPSSEAVEVDAGEDKDGAESTASDPTELFSRDMGTQTLSPPPSPSPNPSLPPAASSIRSTDPVAHHTTALTLLGTHLADLVGPLSTSQMFAQREAIEELELLRHDLDALQYGSGTLLYGGLGQLSAGWDGKAGPWAGAQSMGGTDGGWGKVEQVKKAVREVKGVLLSSRRFPGVGAGVRGGG